jgi:hypothetical protein
VNPDHPAVPDCGQFTRRDAAAQGLDGTVQDCGRIRERQQAPQISRRGLQRHRRGSRSQAWMRPGDRSRPAGPEGGRTRRDEGAQKCQATGPRQARPGPCPVPQTTSALSAPEQDPVGHCWAEIAWRGLDGQELKSLIYRLLV